MHAAVNLINHIVHFIVRYVDKHGNKIKQSDRSIGFFIHFKHYLIAGIITVYGFLLEYGV